jgi:hypothetical protein
LTKAKPNPTHCLAWKEGSYAVPVPARWQEAHENTGRRYNFIKPPNSLKRTGKQKLKKASYFIFHVADTPIYKEQSKIIQNEPGAKPATSLHVIKS